MRILHTADIHARRDCWAEVRASLHALAADARRNGADLIAISGDIAHGPLQNSERDIFDALCAEIQALADIAPVVMIYGTPSHDAPGSLEVFEKLAAAHEIRILRPGRAYLLGTTGMIYDDLVEGPVVREDMKLLLFGVPEPNKKWLLANGGATGKDESDSAVRQAMRSLLLGLGGMRKAHSELPCVLLYHGQVSGARTGTGFGVESGSGLAVSIDDLRAVSADYYALGDIHEPQKIGDLEAYYPGSVYPSSWGETHKAGANVVEIVRGNSDPEDLFGTGPDTTTVKVSRLDFPHPVRLKVSVPDARGVAAELPKVASLLWYEITCTAEETATIDTDALLAECVRNGALPGSRVTLNVLPTETVRAGEIAEKKTLREKVQVWGENSSTTIPETALEKADELELEAAAAGAVASGAHIRITRLRLRGAKGIYKNQRRDEIDLDLETYGQGVIALVGANGQGKTTLLENMHPWPQMLTRDGTLKSHFRLRDSFRDLYFVDERTGWHYRALIQVNAATASGGAEYFLSVDKGQGFQPVEGVTGRLVDYEAAIGSLFGSLELYLRTAFVTQRPSKAAPDLAEATKGERKALFAELSGIDYLEAYRAEAKARADALESDLLRFDATIDAAADVEALLAQLEGDIRLNAENEAAAEGDAVHATETGMRLKAERDLIASRVGELERKAARKADLEREIAAAAQAIQAAETEILSFRRAADGKGKAEAELATIRGLEGEAAALRAEKAKIDEKNRAALVAHQGEVRAVEERRRTAQAALDGKRREASAIERELAGLEARLTAPIADHCPTCAQLLPEAKRAHLAEERRKLEIAVAALKDRSFVLAGEIRGLEEAHAAITTPPAPVLAPFPGAERLEEIEGTLAFFDAPSVEEQIRQAAEAAVRIEAAERRKVETAGRRDAAEAERSTVAEELAALPGAREELVSKDRELEAARERLTAARSAAASARAFGESARRNLEDARARAAARDKARESRGALAATRDDWRLLERATGSDGIQALELDALAPSIAAVANRLLAEAYGSRYAIRFDTTRIGGKGTRTKQIEDFLVQVLDSETGEEQEIATLSGGEGVWIKRALYDAFAAIRAQNTGVKFLTCFQDEADGALDPEARMRYLRMLEAAHRESGRYQTILITHSRELQAMVAEAIDVTSLGVAEGKVEVAA
ncbi:MAG: hypothetical protein JNG85_14680 [Spirochaetaceae bacterium]|nr:hypothetical protein [Spirochaetaceae bacterium]